MQLRARSAPSRSARLAPCALALVLLAAVAGAEEKPRIYKWVDANGIAHYTTDRDRIPKALRDRIQSIERSSPPVPAAAPEPTPAPVAPPTAGTTLAPDLPGAAGMPAAPEGGVVESQTAAAPAPAPGDESWMSRDAAPRPPRGSTLLTSGRASPEELEALDARIAEVEAEIARDEGVLKGLISDPGLDEEVPLFDRPEFLEISERLPQLQARLEELREERAKLGTP